MAGASPAKVLDDARHIGAEDSILKMVPTGIAGEVLLDLNKLSVRCCQLPRGAEQDENGQAHCGILG
jgi:hypothetical protein